MAKITERFSLQEVALENKLGEAHTIIGQLQNEIGSHKTTISNLNKDKEMLTMKLVDANTAACELKNEISELKDQQAHIIEETVQERIRPWVDAKAEAESLGIEIELKNKMLAELRADLNKSKKKNEDLQAQNDQLVRATHKSEEKDAKLFVVQRECEDLRNQLETSRCQLQSKSLEVADLSFTLDEEKYKNSLSHSERSTNSSFRAVYEESNSLDRKLSRSLNGTSPLDGTLSPINGTIYHSANESLNETIDDVFTK